MTYGHDIFYPNKRILVCIEKIFLAIAIMLAYIYLNSCTPRANLNSALVNISHLPGDFEPEEIYIWTVRPIRVYSQLEDPNKTKALEEAIVRWNSLAGCVLFRFTEGVGEVVVLEKAAPKDHPTWLMSAGSNFTVVEGLMKAHIHVHNLSRSYDEDVFTFMHELGHVLGLDHSKDKNSLMYESVGLKQVMDRNNLYSIQKLYCE